ncbi:hypothetical protein [Pseudooceanicola marinus]|uniref:hypothetical protein n=1 Tax=Pseudooceanicola marinus TaxID=396013 RepID=UPI001CD33F96|nr:hypothetical protein [Pseudooceanicola marinus]MCA1336869.1 hypothetical protein [Pseudooceanicola marinus]
MRIEQDQDHETKRDRVRRLLLGPLEGIGFRFPKAVDADEGRKRLDRLADELGYMSDANLRRLFEAMRSKGEGRARDFWPSHAAFVALAQVAQPRPLEEMPGLASWFGSAAGRAALAEGRLVEEYRWWLSKHRPPLNPQERRIIADRAGAAQSKVARLRERISLRLPVDAADREWLHAYEAHQDAARELVRRGQQAQGEAA